jgi:3-methyladenine DNA glycosylase/8-oxoguanine DNA glycosylase
MSDHCNVGDRVTWNWGGGTAAGWITERFTERVTRTIKGTGPCRQPPVADSARKSRERQVEHEGVRHVFGTLDQHRMRRSDLYPPVEEVAQILPALSLSKNASSGRRPSASAIRAIVSSRMRQVPSRQSAARSCEGDNTASAA